MLNLNELYPCDRVFYYFEEISKIPHGSGNTRMIADYLVRVADSLGLEYVRDEYDNVIIRKGATEGYSHRPTVVLQGHLDMVCEKSAECEKDMEKDGLDIYRDGDYIRARGTTLGGDDGIALAYALALLESKDIPHPAIEALFTSDEEIGLLGATALSADMLSGRILINIDSDTEGIFTVGCAGGMRSDVSLLISKVKASGSPVKLTLSGCKGGHSGVEIDKGRENAIKLLCELLSGCDIQLALLCGGNADNAIPREAYAVIYASDSVKEEIKNKAKKMKNRLSAVEPDLRVDVSPVSECADAVCPADSKKIVSLVCDLPSGVIAMSRDIEGLVETSLNLGIMRLTDTSFDLSFSVRSAKGAEKRALADRLAEIAREYGASYSERGGYPAWEYRKDSHLRDVCVETYRNMYKKEPVVVTIHAGLECGILSEKLPGLDSVSLGPDNYDIHTTEEHLSVSSTIRVWEFLKTVLTKI